MLAIAHTPVGVESSFPRPTGKLVTYIDALPSGSPSHRHSARVNVTFQGLSANATAAHIHGPGARGKSAGVLIPLTVPPTTSGTIAQDVALTPTIKSYMIDGLTYVNIHTGNFPSGEIRGQVDSLQAQTATPAASNSGLLLLGVAIAGLGGAVLFRRRAMA